MVKIACRAGRPGNFPFWGRCLLALCPPLCLAAFGAAAGEPPPEARLERILAELREADNSDNPPGEKLRIIEERLLPLGGGAELSWIGYIHAAHLYGAGQVEKAGKVLGAYLANPHYDAELLEDAARLRMAIEKEMEERAKPGRMNLALGGGITLTLASIPAGTFTMGSPESEANRNSDEIRREVVIGQAFYMGVYEVTRAQYRAVMGTDPSAAGTGNHNRPVQSASWHDAGEFCRRLSARTGWRIGLPTEAEWEYACRAGTMTAYGDGDAPEALSGAGNAANVKSGKDGPSADGIISEGSDFALPAPVGQFRPNAWGLYDMHGNVAEWCSDWYGDYDADDRVDPRGAVFGTRRVIRGGSWLDAPEDCRSARRSGDDPGNRSIALGFRVVLREK